MRGHSHFFSTFLSITWLVFASANSLAIESGQTANGCTYKVINGQYLTSCPGSANAALPPAAAASPVLAPQQVTSYDRVPLRRSSERAGPALPPQQPVLAAGESPTPRRERSMESSVEFRESSSRDHLMGKLLDQTYAGILLGASNMKESNAGSSTGVGLNIGTLIDEVFAVEMGYTYARQSLRLGLRERNSSVAPAPSEEQSESFTPATVTSSSADAALSAHLFSGEVQAYLTDPVKRLRPFVGGGLGWRSASLSETASGFSSAGSALSGGSLHQNSLGGLACAGTKLRLTRAFHLGFAFRYFFPLARQDARLEQPAGSNAPSKLSSSDDTLTGSSQYQVLGGLQYSF